jgi:SAM-dependent methyltransferase
MHDSVLDWVESWCIEHKETGQDPIGKVLEVGALDENGSARPIIVGRLWPKTYLATDMRPGRGVDAVVQAEQLVAMYGTRQYDLVVCLEMLEHAEHWQAALHNIKQMVAKGGHLLLSTRSPGFPYHGFPQDHWRFTVDMMTNALQDMQFAAVKHDPDPESPGVLAWAIGASDAIDINSDPCIHVQAKPMEQPSA